MPHTSPSINSPPNGSCRPARFVDGDDVGVTHQAQRRCLRVAALDAATSEPRPGRRLVLLHVETGGAEELAQQVGIAGLEARLGGAVVDAAIADELLQQLDGLPSQIWCTSPLRPYSIGPAGGSTGTPV